MLTMNLWSSIGLCNGATETVVDIIYQNNHQPPDLHIAVIVEFENYRGPVFTENQPLCVPICPIIVTSQTEIEVTVASHGNLRLAWALTIHKSLGLTLPKAWIDIGKSERTAGVSYVAISRVKTLASCVIEPMTYERLTSLKSSANLQYRLEEENRSISTDYKQQCIEINKPLSLNKRWDDPYYKFTIIILIKYIFIIFKLFSQIYFNFKNLSLYV